MNYDNNYVIIDLDALEQNFQAIREKAGVPVMAVIKANAYGCGAVQIATQLKDRCSFFGVSSIQEALELRKAGLENPILILGYTPPEMFTAAIKAEIRVAIFRFEDAKALSEAAVALGMTARLHFKVDTGMNRIGFRPTEADADICVRIAELPNLECEGVFSHLATADCADLTRTQTQKARFDGFVDRLRQKGVEIKLRHLENSAGIINFDEHYEMVRAGIVAYGFYPSREAVSQALPIKPVLSWHSRITHIKSLAAGEQIGYGGSFVTDKAMLVATVPVGYADGYRRSLSNRFYVLINGKKAPIVGRVCMDMMMVDVTDIPDVKQGGTVTLVGKDGDQQITVEQIAQAADSFNYEFICGISRRVPRLYRKDGKTVEQVHYLLDS